MVHIRKGNIVQTAKNQVGTYVLSRAVLPPSPPTQPTTTHTHLSVLLLRLAAAWTPGWDAEEGLTVLSPPPPPPPPVLGEGRWGGMPKAANDDGRGGRCCDALVPMAWLPTQQHRRRAAAEAWRCQGAGGGLLWRLPGMGIWTGAQKSCCAHDVPVAGLREAIDATRGAGHEVWGRRKVDDWCKRCVFLCGWVWLGWVRLRDKCEKGEGAGSNRASL